MQLVKDKEYTEITGDIQIRSLVNLLSYMIDFYASAFVPRDRWCTKQEKQFLIACIIISNKKLKYTSREALDVYREVFNLRRQSDIRGMMVRLEENGWIQSSKEKKEIYLLEFFKMDLSSQKVKFDITLKFSNGTS